MATWTIILAGGDGTRLHAEATRRYGYPRAKQFCDFDGSGTLLDHTLVRARTLVPAARILAVTSRAWKREAGEVLREHPGVREIQQPRNLGTTPGILLPLLAVMDDDPDAVVLVMPSDHHVSNPRAFVDAAHETAELAAADGHHVYLLGVVPEVAVEGCGWIVPEPGGGCAGVSAFREKPDPDELQALFRQGALVNSFVMAGRAESLAFLFARHTPGWWWALAGARRDPPGLEAVYAAQPPSNFSSEVLERAVDRLRVVPMRDAGWSDIGTPERLQRALWGMDGSSARM